MIEEVVFEKLVTLGIDHFKFIKDTKVFENGVRIGFMREVNETNEVWGMNRFSKVVIQDDKKFFSQTERGVHHESYQP